MIVEEGNMMKKRRWWLGEYGEFRESGFDTRCAARVNRHQISSSSRATRHLRRHHHVQNLRVIRMFLARRESAFFGE